MIDFIRIYYNHRRQMKTYIQNESKFKIIYKRFHKKSQASLHQVIANYNYLTYKVDKYKSLVYGSLGKFYSSHGGDLTDFNRDFTYYKLIQAIELLEDNTIDISNSKISGLYFGLTIETSIKGKEIIKKNILMFKLKGFNKDKSGTLKKELKLFEKDDYTLGVFASKDEQYKIRIELQFKNSRKLKKFGINKIMELESKVKLQLLFSEFLKAFDSLTIVDTFNFDHLLEKDKLKMRIYMNIITWSEFALSDKGRKAKSRASLDFKRIQKQYNLNTLKGKMRALLEEQFNTLLNN